MTSTPLSPPTRSEATSFAAALKLATQDVHDEAERSPFLHRLLGGEEPVESYVDYLAQLHAVYGVLEEAAAEHTDDPLAGPFVEPALTRLPSLEADLVGLAGADWADRHRPTAATTALVEHVRATCFDWPGGFVAHHYVRYLGDLSGGQIMRRIIERIYGFADHAGTRFFVFEHLDNGVQFKKRYRELLDETPWTDDERSRISDEAVRAFELNTALINSLG